MEFVDLGLNVKWAKYNLGATCENTPESWYGDYYAWGELKPKNKYNWFNYKFGTQYKLTKYNSILNNVGNHLCMLEPEDDVIQNMCDIWRMPTRDDLKRLLSLPNEGVINYEGINGLNGRIFRGNGNSLFIPAGGHFSDERYNTKICTLWTNTIDMIDPINAWSLYCNFKEKDIYGISSEYRFKGLNVRAVYDPFTCIF